MGSAGPVWGPRANYIRPSPRETRIPGRGGRGEVGIVRGGPLPTVAGRNFLQKLPKRAESAPRPARRSQPGSAKTAGSSAAWCRSVSARSGPGRRAPSESRRRGGATCRAGPRRRRWERSRMQGRGTVPCRPAPKLRHRRAEPPRRRGTAPNRPAPKRNAAGKRSRSGGSSRSLRRKNTASSFVDPRESCACMDLQRR